MDNYWTMQQLKNEIEKIVFEAILLALYKLTNEMTAARKDNDMRF